MTKYTTPTSGAVPVEFLRGVIALCTQRGYSPENIEAWSTDDKWIADLWRQAAQMLAAAPAQPVAEQGVAYAALPEPLEIDWPELHSQALGCGVEDRGLHNRYECAEYGWQDGVDKCAERVPEQIFDADQMLAFADATCALRAAHGQAPADAAPSAGTLLRVESGHPDCVTLHTVTPAQAVAEPAKSAAYAELPDLSDADGEIWSAIIDWKNAERGEDALQKADKLDRVLSAQMRAFADATCALRASHGQAPANPAPSAAAALPEGWVPLVITHEGQYPEDIAYGPQIMMDRLGKWLGKYFAQAAQADSVLEDAARLDFIERHPEMSLRHRKGRWAFLGFTNYEYEMLPSLRAAIDAASKQGEKQ